MKVVSYEDPHAYRRAVEGYLLQDEPRHNVMLGIATTLTSPSPPYEAYRLWTVEDGGRVVGAALRTPPHSLLLAAPARPAAVEVLAAALATADPEMPGVGGALPEAEEFAEAWTRITGVGIRARMDQAMHVLEEVQPVPLPSGSPRLAGPDDLELALDWYRAFGEEATPHETWNEERARRLLTRRLAGVGGHGTWLWVDARGEPACLVGFINATERAARLAPVYTPPALRKRGYATALTAHVSRELLARGKRFCMLYTDLANPTSNAVYARVGYRVVCDAAAISFGTQA